MTEIEIVQESYRFWTGLFFISLFPTVVGLIMGATMYFDNSKLGRTLALIGGISLVILIIALINSYPLGIELSELKQERDEVLDKKLQSMSCKELRLDILDILKNEKEKYIEKKLEWEQDYYYHLCEIPLREEILKLQ